MLKRRIYGSLLERKMNKHMKNFMINGVFKLIDGNAGLSERKRTHPHYMVMYF